jgi:hypothetical protein
MINKTPRIASNRIAIPIGTPNTQRSQTGIVNAMFIINILSNNK